MITFLLIGIVEVILVKYLTGLTISCVFEVLRVRQSPPPVYRIPQRA
jgi:hypothetical protein